MADPAADNSPRPPEHFERIYEGDALDPFYAAEMLRLHLGKTVWVKDSSGRTRCGQVKSVPNVREDRRRSASVPPPVEFEDERPLYLREIVCIAVYRPPFEARPARGKR